MSIKWIKITTDMFEDEKLDFIMSLPESDSIIVVWIRLLTLAGKCNAGGYVLLTENIAYTEEMLAHKFRKSPTVLRLAIETLKRLKMVELEEETLRIVNWEKHQNVEAMDKVKEYERLRKARQRENKKQLLLAKNPGTCPGNVPDSPGDVRSLDIDLDKENNNISFSEIIIPDEKQIFDHWNTKKIVVHRELTKTTESSIRARLEKRTADEIMSAINNYCEILKGEKYWFSYKWGLNDFMNPKNLDKFLDENDPKRNFLHNKYKEKIPTQSPVVVPLDNDMSEEEEARNADIIRRQQELLRSRTGTTSY